MYTNIYKIYNIYIYTKYQAAAARPGPEPPGPDRGSRLGAGPGCRRPVFCTYVVYLVYKCMYLDIFGYIVVFSW